MITCLDPANWKIRFADGQGRLSCGRYRGRFRLRGGGMVQITWIIGPKAGPDYARIQQAAAEACYRALQRH